MNSPRVGRLAQMSSDSNPAAESVLEVLELVSECEAVVVDRFYARFFERNPEVVPLFGVYALAEREEMMKETLKSVLAGCEGEPWLEGNLVALGASHAEYGVTAEMYPAFVSAFLETLREILGDRLSPEAEKGFGEMLETVCAVMCEAGESAA